MRSTAGNFSVVLNFKKFCLGYLHSLIINTTEEFAHNVTSELELQRSLDQASSINNFPLLEIINFDEVI